MAGASVDSVVEVKVMDGRAAPAVASSARFAVGGSMDVVTCKSGGGMD